MPAKGFRGQANALLNPETLFQRHWHDEVCVTLYCFPNFYRGKLKLWLVLILGVGHGYYAM